MGYVKVNWRDACYEVFEMEISSDGFKRNSARFLFELVFNEK